VVQHNSRRIRNVYHFDSIAGLRPLRDQMARDMKWVSFHTHTTYSYGDGFGTVKQHVDRVSSLGMGALALTEHGNVNSHASLERFARDAGIKPIFGIEAYFAPPNTRSKFHITLCAQDDEGYRNLNRIVTQSYLDAYQFPTVTWENLKENNRGIVVLSGCADSLISCTLLGGKSLGDKRDDIRDEDYQRALRRIRRFVDVFTTERFFLEVQRFSGLGRTCTLNPALRRLSSDTGVSLLATADVHYPYGHQNQIQKVLHASRRSSSVAIAEQEWEYNVLLTYPESDEEIHGDLVSTGLSESDATNAIQATADLAELCNVELPKARPLRFAVPEGYKGGKHYLKRQLIKGWQHRRQQRSELEDKWPQYKERVQTELKVIYEKSFEDYFLATADLVAWAKDQGIAVGPGRGSAVASLVCYLLRITEIDPLTPPFDKMIFERFLDPTRSDPPDIDLDFDDERRSEVTARAREIYGENNVAAVANHIGYRAKNSLAGVARAYGLPQKLFDPIGIRCASRTETDERVDDSIADAVESYGADPEIAALVDNYPDQIRLASDLEGNEHSMGTHAGGFVFASDPIPDNVCPIYTKTKGTGRSREVVQVIPYEKRDAEYLGMLKMDFLGLTTMGMIGKAIGWAGINLDELYSLFYAAPEYEHERILEMFQIDDVTGIFQYEGGTTRALTRRVKPATFDELAICNALSRPGPYYGRAPGESMTQADKYVAVKHGEMDWERIHPNFDQHVEWTNGQLVYQEQIMRVLRDLAGFDTASVLRIRKIIGKKLGEHQFEGIWQAFRDGCNATSGIQEDAALAVFGSIRTAAGYAFNIPHSYSYALIAWWSAYLKCHHKVEFFASSLAKNGDGKDQIPRRTALLKDAQRNRLTIKPFKITECRTNWEPRYYDGHSDGDGVLQPGFCQIPGIAEATADDMLRWVDTLPYENWPESGLTWDELARPNDKGGCYGFSDKTVDTIKSFVSGKDPLGINRTEDQIMAFRSQLVNGDFDATGIPSDEEFVTSATLPEDNDHVAFVGLVANVVYRDEIESIRARTGQTVDEIKASLDDPDKTKKATVFAYDEFGEVALRVSRWMLPRLSDRLAQVKTDYHLVVAWGRTFENKSGAIQVKNLWVFDPD
jgi:DNA polymerase-3 subunit alpha